MTAIEVLHKHWKEWHRINYPEATELDMPEFMENNEHLEYMIPAMEEYKKQPYTSAKEVLAGIKEIWDAYSAYEMAQDNYVKDKI